jgi:hypothetical protein
LRSVDVVAEEDEGKVDVIPRAESEEIVKQLEKGLPPWSLDSEKWGWMVDVTYSGLVFLVYMRKLIFSPF